jgi:hypothetical protein
VVILFYLKEKEETTYNPKHHSGQRQEDYGSRPTWAKSERLYFKKQDRHTPTIRATWKEEVGCLQSKARGKARDPT